MWLFFNILIKPSKEQEACLYNTIWDLNSFWRILESKLLKEKALVCLIFKFMNSLKFISNSELWNTGFIRAGYIFTCCIKKSYIILKDETIFVSFYFTLSATFLLVDILIWSKVTYKVWFSNLSFTLLVMSFFIFWS